MNAITQIFQQDFGIGKVRIDEPLADHTSFKSHGVTSLYIDVDNTADLIRAIKTARDHDMPVRVIGGGTNAIFSGDFAGLVIKNNCRKIETMRMKGKMHQGEIAVEYILLSAESGVITNQLVRQTLDEGLSGLEYALGLPGTVGGALYMNANYPKREKLFGEAVHSAQILTSGGEVRTVDSTYFSFGFDTSSLQHNGDIVLSVTFQLIPLTKEIVWERGMEASTYRIETQPKGHITGHTFRNIQVIDSMKEPGKQQIPLEMLIDQAGLKGVTVGGATLYDANPRYILNSGTATAEDVENLLKKVKDTIFSQFKVQLHMNAHVIGHS